MRKCVPHVVAFVLISFFVVLPCLPAAAADAWWDGATNPNASGSWGTASNWEFDALPGTGDAAVLDDVTAGLTRYVTLSTTTSISQLQMTQIDNPGRNILILDANGQLTLSGAEAFVQTLGVGVSPDRMVLNLSGGSMLFTDSGATMTNRGSVAIAGGGSMQFVSAVGGATNLNNAGVIILSGGSISKSISGTFTINNNAGASFTVSSGTNTLGASASTRRNYYFNNSGSLNLSSGASLVLKSVSAGGTDVEQDKWVLRNLAGGTLNIGTSSGGSALLTRVVSGTGMHGTLFENSGTFNVYGSSRIQSVANDPGAYSFKFSNLAGGVLNLVGDSTGVLLGQGLDANLQASPMVENSGTMNVKVLAGAPAGLAVIGNDTSNALARGGVTLTNKLGGTLTVDDNASLRLAARSSTQGGGITITNAAGANLTLGNNAGGTAGGKLVLDQEAEGGLPLINNSGTMTLNGASTVELLVGADKSIGFMLNNQVGGVLNLNHNSVIGSTAAATIFNNTGSLNKTGAGTAYVHSASNGWSINNGNISLADGKLVFDTSLASSGDISGSGSLEAALFDLSAGTVSANLTGAGSLAKNGPDTAVISGSNTYAGDTAISAGTLSVLSPSALPNTSNVSIASGATLSLSGNGTVATLSGNGSATLSGCSLTLAGDGDSTVGGVISGNGGLVKNGIGTLRLSNTSTYSGATSVNVGTLALDGAVAGNVTVGSNAKIIGNGSVGSLLTVNGSISTLGGAAGQFRAGSATFGGGSTFDVQMNGLATDKLTLTDVLTLSGTSNLALTFLGDSALGGDYSVITYASHAGSGGFAVTSNFAPYITGVTVGANAVTVNVKPFIGGDADLSGSVNVLDLAKLASNYGSSGTWSDADFDGNGIVNVLDLAALAGNYGTSVAAAGAAAVPEPATLALLAIGACRLLRRRKD